MTEKQLQDWEKLLDEREDRIESELKHLIDHKSFPCAAGGTTKNCLCPGCNALHKVELAVKLVRERQNGRPNRRMKLRALEGDL